METNFLVIFPLTNFSTVVPVSRSARQFRVTLMSLCMFPYRLTAIRKEKHSCISFEHGDHCLIGRRSPGLNNSAETSPKEKRARIALAPLASRTSPKPG
jgi:hypothetical protein